jgi:hypothetical protein
MAAPHEALAKYGGGDGNRTHVRIANNPKRYMLILCLYSMQQPQRHGHFA